jgi:hypothetical protein
MEVSRMQYQCPGDEYNDLVGCGSVFDAEPDEEGLVDCPVCGMWFTPILEAQGVGSTYALNEDDRA